VPRRVLSQEFKLEVLAAYTACGSIAATARRHRIRPETVREWIRDPLNADAIDRFRRDLVTEVSAKALALASEALDQVRAKLSDASARDAAVIGGIMVDKVLALRPMAGDEQKPRSAAEFDKVVDQVIAIRQERQRRDAEAVRAPEATPPQLDS